MTVLLEYLNFALDTHSWVSLHNSLTFIQILLYYCKEFLWCAILTTDRFSAHYSERLDFFHKFDHVILTLVGFCHISAAFSGFLSNHKIALLRWLLHLFTKFHPIPCTGLPCRHDLFYMRKKSIITP